MIEILMLSFAFALICGVTCLCGIIIGRRLGHEDQLAKRKNDLEQARYWLNVIAVQGGDIQEPWSAEIARRALHGAMPTTERLAPPLLLTKQIVA